MNWRDRPVRCSKSPSMKPISFLLFFCPYACRKESGNRLLVYLTPHFSNILFYLSDICDAIKSRQEKRLTLNRKG